MEYNLQIAHTREQLLSLGFTEVFDGDEEYYLEKVLDEQNYFDSKFLATESITIEEYKQADDFFKYKVISPYNVEGEDYLRMEQIREIIMKGDF